MKPKDFLFQRFPLDGRVMVADEELTTPYHVYDGVMLCMNGTVDGKKAADLLAQEGLTPLLDTQGRALAAIWICDFVKANLGAHQELQISLFATPVARAKLPAHPFAFFGALANRPDLHMVCHGLWNDTLRVVRYNDEHLRLPARLTRSEIKKEGELWRFRFADTAGDLIAEGSILHRHGSSIAPAWRIAGQTGLKGMMTLMRAPAVNIPVVNLRRAGETHNHVCQTYTTYDRAHVRAAGPSDEVTIRHPVYAPLDFKPAVIQQFDNVGFIFLRPEPLFDDRPPVDAPTGLSK